ncbi:MAG: phosphoenolpyruvate--protein phosphotransferase [Verrucomicrobiae bacterium]|nr:phosphoenolpyruvate--protein phosphotransferase [Verrucomicrobiae bacterium]
MNDGEERRLEGIAVSRGVCVGKALVLGVPIANPARTTVPEEGVPAELERLEQALVETRRQLVAVHARVSQAIGPGDAGIFDAHLLVLDDPTMLEHVVGLIEKEHVTADYAFDTVSQRYADALAGLEDEYLAERVSDLRDVATRVVNNLRGGHVELDLEQLTEPHVIISHDLAPSTTAMLDRSKVLGFGIDTGGKTSHAAILARSLRLPAVVGMQDASRKVENGQTILLDGYTGVVIVNPSKQTLFEYGQLEKRQQKFDDRLREIQSLAATTADGFRVSITANLEAATGAGDVISAGAEGVGLFRTEYLYLNNLALPTEDEQFAEYVRAARALQPHPVVFRTLDIGGDKFPACYRMDKGGAETNPFLGWRGIRFCLEESSVFRTQLRAILRASGVENNVRLMYPMISGAEELDQSNERLEECRRELVAEGIAFDRDLKIGTMIEVPSAVMIGDVLAKRCDFFSIGTNDLIQYALAADRMNEKVAYLYDPAHPAIIRLIKMTVDAGHRNGIHVAVCGEMASDPVMVPILLGLGVDELSVSPSLVAPVKYLVRRLKMSEARDLAVAALSSESSGEVLSRAQELAHCVAPELFDRS